MDELQEMRNTIAGLEKDISLNQMAKLSGINYVTLLNIKKEKSKRVTDNVRQRFDAFVTAFKAGEVAPVKAKPGPKKGAKKKAAAKPAAKKAVKKAAKKAVAKKAAVKKAAAKAKPAAVKAAPKKRGPKPGAKKKAVAPKPVEAPTEKDFASPMLGQALDREIEIAEARLEYLKSMREIEVEFLKALRRK